MNRAVFPIFFYFCSVKELSDIIRPIANDLLRFESFFEQTLHAETEPMDSIMCYVRETRGKRLRPILVLLSANLHGEVNERTLHSATFIEMIHSATLIHDDIVDDDDIRRGKSSVKARWGNSTAVLAGDYLLAKAMLMLVQLGDFNIMQEMLHTAASMSEGELLQNQVVESIDTIALKAQHDNSPSKDQYLDIITRKTAMLMRSCCTVGALSTGATREQVQQISQFGINFGILFQLRDDMLDCENLVQAKALLPIYYEKALKALEELPPSEITETLRDLTVFCAEREG